MKLFRLAYLSCPVIKVTNDILLNLLLSARQKNHSLEITGTLIHGHGVFFQILEGRKDEVLELFSSIKDDGRHEKIRILFQEPVSERHFKNWSMCYIKIEETRLDRSFNYNQFLRDYKKHDKVSMDTPVINQLKTFSKEQY